MSVNRVVLVVLLAGCLFFAWILIQNAFFKESSEPMTLEQVKPERVIIQPSAPSQASPLESEESVVYGQPRPHDSSDEGYESSEMRERLRNPDRMFKKASKPDTGDIAADGGLASFRGVTSRDTPQQFSPELAQNGGEFMDNIFANDGEVSTYSTI